MALKKEKETEISVLDVKRGRLTVYVIGQTPLILHKMSAKAKHELLYPKGRKTTGDRATNLKHDPIVEFNDSAHTLVDENAPTLLAFPSAGFKGAMCNAALDIPGAKKAQVGRLSWVEGDYVGIYGSPKLFMSITRSSDMNHTPDVRTRVIIPHWAAKVVVSYVVPMLNETTIANLMAAAGMYIGVGDWRNGKGESGNYGLFSLVNEDDPQLMQIMKVGRAAQINAMKAADPYDTDTSELLSWFNEEVTRRGASKQLKAKAEEKVAKAAQ